eukprot:g5891.t1
MRRSEVLALVMAAGLACTGAMMAAGPARGGQDHHSAQMNEGMNAGDEELPISSITLYRSGVGAFQRQGMVHNDGRVSLSFDSDQINDILKSMVMLDLDGGRIEAASYGSKEPLARRLASFAIDISDNPSRGELLDQLRGARVSISHTEGRLSGIVLGVEAHETMAPGYDTLEIRESLNLLTDAGTRTIPLGSISSFQIEDEKLAAELRRALQALGEHRADNVKAVDLAFRGEGDRRVVVSYVHEMPGWAIVENTTDEDWEGVDLSLVAGRPVSFVMDLYEPLYLGRPEVPVPVTGGARPKVYAQGKAAGGGGGQSPFSGQTATRGEVQADSLREMGRMSGGLRAAQSAAAPEFSYSADDMANYAAQAQASAGEVGEVFQYTLDEPVTIERRRSAMLPILSAPIQSRRVSIFNRSDNAKHPMRGVELTNTSGLQLMPGPISVYDDATYAGDAQIGHVSDGDERLLAYSVDLAVSAQSEQRNDRDVTRLRIHRGLIEQTVKSVETTTYSFESSDSKRDRVVIVEHARRGGWDLVGEDRLTEKTDSAYRFEVKLEPGGEGELRVSQENVQRQNVALVGFDMTTLLRYQRDGRVSRAVIEAVRKAGELQDRIRQSEQLINELEQERRVIGTDQTRIRENMGRIDRTSELYGRYMSKLNDQETRLEQIEREIAEARAELERRRGALNDYVSGLEVE